MSLESTFLRDSTLNSAIFGSIRFYILFYIEEGGRYIGAPFRVIDVFINQYLWIDTRPQCIKNDRKVQEVGGGGAAKGKFTKFRYVHR